MDGVTEDEVDAAQRAIVAELGRLFPGDLGSLHLDYTNYHTWIDSRNGRCTICLRGHNKQKRNDLRQFALAMLTAAATRGSPSRTSPSTSSADTRSPGSSTFWT